MGRVQWYEPLEKSVKTRLLRPERLPSIERAAARLSVPIIGWPSNRLEQPADASAARDRAPFRLAGTAQAAAREAPPRHRAGALLDALSGVVSGVKGHYHVAHRPKNRGTRQSTRIDRTVRLEQPATGDAMTLSLATLLVRGPRDRDEPPQIVAQDPEVKIALRGVDVYYGEHRALRDVHLDLYRYGINVLLGASGSGKSTVLRTLNRLVETVPHGRIEGIVSIDGRNVLARTQQLTRLRRRFGVVVQKPNPFPRSIYDNVAYGPRIHRTAVGKGALDRLVRRSLERVGLWHEVAGRLRTKATELSVGQQQRLCLARALAYEPEILLLDEPFSGLDPISAQRVEDLILALSPTHTVVLATHELAHAARVARHAAFLHRGRLVEQGASETLLTDPREAETRAFIDASPPPV